MPNTGQAVQSLEPKYSRLIALLRIVRPSVLIYAQINIYMLGNVAARVLQFPPFVRRVGEGDLRRNSLLMTAAGKSVHGMVYDGNDGQPCTITLWRSDAGKVVS